MLGRIVRISEVLLSNFFSLLRTMLALLVLSKSRELPGNISKAHLKRILSPDCTIVEVGCHVGIDTLQLSLTFPKAKILAFEPNLKLLFEAHSRTRLRANVTLFPVALSDQCEARPFFVSSGSSTGSSSLLRPTLHLEHHPEVQFRNEDTQLVFTSTLDEIQAHLELESIDLLWIDVQGAELEVLRGCQKTLPQIRYIYTEVSINPLYSDGATYLQIQSFLEEEGFEVVEEFLPKDWGGEGNVLFGRRSMSGN